MTEEPDRIIEEYLALVNEHLPESISDDVITELRTYMYETARDLGEGEITLQSAKKVVAQFGAPSEVAEEYKYSMLPETIPPRHEDKQTKKSDVDSGNEVASDEIQHPDKGRKEPVSPVTAVVQGASIAIVWAFLVVLASTLLGPVWLAADYVMILLIQVTLAVSGLMAMVYLQNRQNKELWKQGYSEWSLTQKFLTLPENTFPEPTNLYLAIDSLGSIIGILMFFFSTMYQPSPYYLLIITIPVSVALIGKLVYNGKRIGFHDPVKYVDVETTLAFIILVFIDSSQVWFYASVGGSATLFFKPLFGFYFGRKRRYCPLL